MATSSAPYQDVPGGWDWPEDLPEEVDTQGQTSTANPTPSSQSDTSPPENKRPKTWKPRTCRICLETVLPTFNTPSENIPEMLQGAPSVTYESEGGRLTRPCNCKGSSKWVHDGCLQQWRHADPSYGKRNYWNCPTCGFKYRLGRISWGHWLSSTAAQLSLTLFIFMFTVFALGFVADPIINMYLDPITTISSIPSSYETGTGAVYDEVHFFDEEEDAAWFEHFMKGFASLGLLGAIKVFISITPWHWWNMRHFLTGGTRTGNTGRERIANVSWFLIMAGVLTFVYFLQLFYYFADLSDLKKTVWKVVRAWSRRVLVKAGERVMDVQGDDGPDDDDDETDDAHGKKNE